MIKSNMSKKLLISLLMIFAVLFIKASYSHAATKFFNSFDELAGSREFYCIQHGIPVTKGTWVSGSTEVVASASGWESDRILAYILADAERTGDTGYNNNGDHQEAVWHWYTPSSIGANDVYNDAAAAAKTPINSTNSAELETGSLTVIEDIASLPIEEITGKINKIEVQFKDPVSKQTYTQTITTGNSGVNGWIEVYSDESCKNSINIENIKAGNVYFKILKENYEIVDIKCNVKADEAGYKVTITNWQKDTEASTEQDLITASVRYGEKEKDVTIKAVYPTGKLCIVKVDKHFNEVRPDGAKFKIHSKIGWVVKLTDGTIIYTGSESEATEFATSKENNGQIDVVLRYGKYDVYETKAPIGYDITKQDGYMNNNGKDPYSFSQNNKWVYTGRAEIYANTLNNNVLQYTVTNKKVVDKLRGRVWVDNPDTKANNYNNILDENGNDKLIAGIKVTLFDQNNKEVAVTTTDANGYYEFTSKNSPNYTGEDKNLYYWELAGSYVEFTYDNQTYIVADPFAGNSLKVNSKAMEYQMTVDELEDEKLTGTEGNLPGKAITYRNTTLTTPEQILVNNGEPNKDLKTTPLTGYYNNETYTVDDINLGIKTKHEPTFDISETLEYIKVNMNGYSYKYQHGKKPETYSDYVPKAATQIGDMRFSQALYPSDIEYLKVNDKGMEVYVVYDITVSNNETSYIDDIYNEQRLYLNSLENTFDSNRYELCNDENKTDSSDFELWGIKDGKAVYDVYHNNSPYKDGIEKGKSITARIQFKVQKDALKNMLEHYKNAQAEKYYETAPTVATVDAYHDYLRTDNVWDEKSSAKSYDNNKIGKYSEKNNANETYFVHKSNRQTKSSANLYINLTLGKDRKLKGKVFEDYVEKDTLGNGQLDDNERERAKAVKVDLMKDKTNFADLYRVEQNEQTNVVTLEEITSTDEKQIFTDDNGEYTIDGVVPGYYYIRFTYGDGKQKMIDTTGKEIDITSKDYKSTIITNENIQNVMKAEDNKNYEEAKTSAEWYKDLDKDYSTAVDDLDQRKAINGYVYKDDEKVYNADGTVTTDIMTINAYTPIIGISIENDKENVATVNAGTEQKNEFTGFNLGLIKQPDTRLIIEKKIKDVKVKNQVGATVSDEKSVKALDEKRTYVKYETDSEQIYGSSLEVTYEITITNDSPIDYTDDSYYKYGIITDGNVKKAYVQEVYDYLDSKYNYDSLPSKAVQIKGNESKESKEVILKTEKEAENKYIKMTDWEAVACGESTTITYTASALISNNEEDLLYLNNVKIKAMSISTLSTLNTKSAKKENWPVARTTFTITPATGGNRNETYLIVETIALAIIIAGIILIKKKVL